MTRGSCVMRLYFLHVRESGMVMIMPLSEVVMLQKVVRVWVGNWCWEPEDEDREYGCTCV